MFGVAALLFTLREASRFCFKKNFFGKGLVLFYLLATFYIKAEELFFFPKSGAPPLVMCGTVKQEVDAQEEEAASFDNSERCEATVKNDTRRTHIRIYR